ncbi:MAG: hypothetical protein LBP40_05905, partial [Campylobacteraceae bacterium]|nr:hypothetical protein [Campylobacteraceae bacterium]
FPLRDEAEIFIGKRGVAVFCHAISEQNDCLLCSVYFRRELKKLGFDLDNLSFSYEELLLERFGRALTKDANGIGDELFGEFKNSFSEEEIVVLTSFAALMIATNLINKALDIELDDGLQIYTKEEKPK